MSSETLETRMALVERDISDLKKDSDRMEKQLNETATLTREIAMTTKNMSNRADQKATREWQIIAAVVIAAITGVATLIWNLAKSI